MECQTLSLVEAATVLGIGKRTAYALARDDRFPVPVLTIGGTKKVSRAQLDLFLAPK